MSLGDATLRVALNLITEMMAKASADDLENALGFTVCTHDMETRTRSYTGFWKDPVEAIAWSVRHQEALNKGVMEGEELFITTVELINKAE